MKRQRTDTRSDEDNPTTTRTASCTASSPRKARRNRWGWSPIFLTLGAVAALVAYGFFAPSYLGAVAGTRASGQPGAMHTAARIALLPFTTGAIIEHAGRDVARKVVDEGMGRTAPPPVCRAAPGQQG